MSHWIQFKAAGLHKVISSCCYLMKTRCYSHCVRLHKQAFNRPFTAARFVNRSSHHSVAVFVSFITTIRLETLNHYIVCHKYEVSQIGLLEERSCTICTKVQWELSQCIQNAPMPFIYSGFELEPAVKACERQDLRCLCSVVLQHSSPSWSLFVTPRVTKYLSNSNDCQISA